ncbi:hypothetical protein [Moraxella bovis]|uniref:Uncharacterized protein n=2 Tax=Moraxella bovis TaxID=476 RepID=A0A378PXN3_MORBO|nr:hypothetical protein [Moraxella bovis]WAJ74461.1 hypothetical protein LP095_04745 [Moraxella bovis]STY93269.1 Uncharacterised protein [Moraxella bovis]
MSNRDNFIKRELKRMIQYYIKPRIRSYLWKIARRIIDKIVR